jgi:hypothetical protein
MSFDNLTFARRLKSAGFTEALADANRELVVQTPRRRTTSPWLRLKSRHWNKSFRLSLRTKRFD